MIEKKSLTLTQALRLKQTSRVAIVGGGGKTSTLFQSAEGLKPPVLLTTSTHLGIEQIAYAGAHFFVRTPEDVEKAAEALPKDVVLFTRDNLPNGRTTAPDNQTMRRLFKLAEDAGLPLLMEADGARCLPLKAPAAHEPVIPAFINYVVVAAGLSGLGKPLDESTVHRPELFTELCGLTLGESITPTALAAVLCHLQGGLKGIPAGAELAVLLNQADTPELQSAARSMAPRLLEVYDRVLVTSLREKKIHAVYEKIAGIILAAGGASRMKAPKLLLEWRGETFIHHAARTALEAGLDPVIVVTGAYAAGVEQAVKDLPVKLARNPNWDKGQSASVRRGLAELPGRSGGAIFLLGDQPQIPSALVDALVERHSQSMAPITAPLVDGQRGNPLLWDNATFEDLLKLEGDAGGRQLLAKYAVDYVPWVDARVLLDVDTPEDYQRFIDETG